MADTRYVFPDDVPPPGGPYTPVVVVGELAFLCGQVPRSPAGELAADDIDAQTRQVFANMAQCLASVGCTFADVVKVNAFLADWSDFAGFNAVYEEAFSQPYPVRTTVPAPMPSIRVEVECIARIPGAAS
jgi:2-iminobutanoate/2-iminopropanoate deaminase